MKKISAHLGLNIYPNPANNLRGCVNDALDFADFFKIHEKVEDQVILVNSKVKIQPATDLIISKLQTCVAGDHFIMTNSSHGSSIPDSNGDEIDGRDEVLCWYDGFWSDDNFRKIIDSAPAGVNITIFSDSCHSGTVTRDFIQDPKVRKGYKRAKFISPDDPSFAAMLSKLPVKKRIISSGVQEEQMRELLVSGCKSNEYSYDAFIGGRNNGAFTRAVLDVLTNSCSITGTQFYQALMTKLPTINYPQTPQFEGSSVNKNRIMFS